MLQLSTTFCWMFCPQNLLLQVYSQRYYDGHVSFELGYIHVILSWQFLKLFHIKLHELCIVLWNDRDLNGCHLKRKKSLNANSRNIQGIFKTPKKKEELSLKLRILCSVKKLLLFQVLFGVLKNVDYHAWKIFSFLNNMKTFI